MMDALLSVVQTAWTHAAGAWEHIDDLNQGLKLLLNVLAVYKLKGGNNERKK